MNDQCEWRALFAPGPLVETPEWLTLADRAAMYGMNLLLRHVMGDFGVVDEEDAAANRRAIAESTRILSAYEVDGERLWIITESDRSVTTFLLPSEY